MTMEPTPRAMLGIIGGAGVAATNLLQTRIEEAFTRAGAFRDAHHPEMVCYQATQAPSRSMYLEGRGETFVPHYQRIAQQLEQAGASLIAMCCNTAHAAYPDIAGAVSVPIVNLIDETVTRVASSSAKKIGLIASDGCVVSGIYQNRFSELCGDRELVIPSTEDQALISQGIVNVKTTLRYAPVDSPQRPADLFSRVVNSLREQGCDAVILGCTDIAVDFDAQRNPDVIVFDSHQILADALVKRLMALQPGNANAMHFYNDLSLRIKGSEETKNKAKDGSAIDMAFILKHAKNKDALLDMGSGGGLIVNGLVSEFASIVAVEKFPAFSRFIRPHPNLSVVNADLLDFKPSRQFTTVTIFACLNYFNLLEASCIYRKAWDALEPGGTLIVKHQMGVKETVLINRISHELGQYYFSQYRALTDEMTMLKLAGFENTVSFDIYPPDHNHHVNTHYYAITATKPHPVMKA
jgi:aspartate racemase